MQTVSSARPANHVSISDSNWLRCSVGDSHATTKRCSRSVSRWSSTFSGRPTCSRLALFAWNCFRHRGHDSSTRRHSKQKMWPQAMAWGCLLRSLDMYVSRQTSQELEWWRISGIHALAVDGRRAQPTFSPTYTGMMSISFFGRHACPDVQGLLVLKHRTFERLLCPLARQKVFQSISACTYLLQ